MPPELFSVERKSEIGRLLGKNQEILSRERKVEKLKRGRRKAKRGAANAAQFASIEFFHWLAIAMNRRRHERFQEIDNNGRRRMSVTMIEVARFKTL
jgi:hypothetical protein